MYLKIVEMNGRTIDLFFLTLYVFIRIVNYSTFNYFISITFIIMNKHTFLLPQIVTINVDLQEKNVIWFEYSNL